MPDDPASRRRLLIARCFAHLVLLWNFGVGIAWLCGSPHRSMTATYEPARKVHEMLGLPADAARWWGALLLGLVVVAWAALTEGNDRRLRVASAPLVGYWIFWAFLFTLALFRVDDSGIVPIFFALMCGTGSARAVATDDSWERVK